jgi:hypothetical protein
MVVRSSLLTILCLLVFLAPLRLSSGSVAKSMRPGSLTLPRHLASVHAGGAQHAAHISHPIADDGVTHFFARLQPLEVLSSSAFLLPIPFQTTDWTQKDLLSLTQRRRE